MMARRLAGENVSVMYCVPCERPGSGRPSRAVVDCSDLALDFLESVSREPQGAAVLGHVADELVAGAVGQLSVNFECNLDVGVDDAGQVLHNLFGDSGCVAAKADRVELDRAVKTAELRRWRYGDARGIGGRC